MGEPMRRNSAFHRSNSSSNIPSQLSHDFIYPHGHQFGEDVPRSASYTTLPSGETESSTLADYFDNDVDIPPLPIPDIPSRPTSPQKKDIKDGGKKAKTSTASKPEKQKSTKSSWMSRMFGKSEAKEAKPERPSPLRRTISTSQERPAPPRRPLIARPRTSQSIMRVSMDDTSSFASSSRSPSPHKKIINDLGDDYSTPASSVSSVSPKTSVTSLPDPEKITDRTPTRTTAAGLMRRGSVFMKRSMNTETELSPSPTLPNNNFPTRGLTIRYVSGTATPVPSKSIPRGLMEKVPVIKAPMAEPKDELWPIFRSIEADHHKFVARTSALKAGVVRTTLLPFLRNRLYIRHPSLKVLSAAHLERRVNVLNKWWLELLYLLQMQNGLSGMDRPAILEAITAIMARPEWRLGSSAIAPLSLRHEEEVSRNMSSLSLGSDTSEASTDSVYQNTEAVFIQNLRFQMVIIVDKMSLRHAPASLVTFCGTATAYAFFFVPGIADVLVQSLKLPMDAIKRVADEFGLPRRTRLPNQEDEIVTTFPSNLHALGWTSPRALVNQIRKPVPSFKSTVNFPDHGIWVNRWCGRDSELFYDFCKHYHVLLEEFIPRNTPFIEKARAPAFVLVHAQIVTILDATLHKSTPVDDLASNPSPQVDDILARTDASIASMPISPFANMARLMSENRLIMLVRDFLARPYEQEEAQQAFAEAFSRSLKTAAKKTSLYNHSACLILCDFLEELWPIYAKYHRTNDHDMDLIDWRFWLDAWHRMLDSSNNFTVIRLFTFIYTIWDDLKAVDSRLEAVCLEWLLHEDTFEKFFLSWCPMMRAYYMRLLAWRVCRFDGTATQLDTEILSTVSDRLKAVLAYYQYQKQAAVRESATIPSSIPCNPAPGRHLLIIRSDARPPSPLLTFDDILANVGGTSATCRQSALLGPPKENHPPSSSPEKEMPKRRWSILGKTQSTERRPIAPSQPTSSTKLEAARQETANASSRPSLSNSLDSYRTALDEPPKPGFKPFSFKFSLEWHHKQNMSVMERRACNRDQPLFLPKLPAPAFKHLLDNVPGAAGGVLCVDPGERSGKKYAGRALAEWAQMVREHDGFVERRMAEGVPTLADVEVPRLKVDDFTRHG